MDEHPHQHPLSGSDHKGAAASMSASPLNASAAESAAALEALARATPLGRVGPRARRLRKPGVSSGRARRARITSLPLRANMTPMIDVVFLLLVFFISTTRFSVGEGVLNMDLARRALAAPVAAANAPAAPKPAEDPFVYREDALILEVLPDGRIQASSPFNQAYSPEELRMLLARECRSVDHPGGMFEASFPIVIAPAVGTSWQAAVEALNTTVAAGYRNVGFDQRGRARSGATAP